MVELDKILRDAFQDISSLKVLSFSSLLPSFILSIVLIFVVIVITAFIQKRIFCKIEDVIERQHYRKYILYSSILIIITGLLIIWFEPIMQTIVILSAFTVGIIIGFKEIITCLSGRFLIAINRSYDIGDRIEIAGHTGDVIDMGIFDTTLLEVGGIIPSSQSSGRIIYIPHSLIISNPIINYAKKGAYIWDEIILKTEPDGKWEEIKKLLFDFCNEVTKEEQKAIEKDMKEVTKEFAYKLPPLTPIVYTDFADGKVIVSLRYMVAIRNRRNVRHKIIELVLSACKEKGIKPG